MRLLLALAVLLSSAAAQQRATPAATGGGTKSPSTFFYGDELVFPHLAVGGGWTTQFVLLNMVNATAAYKLQFFDPFGQALSVTFQSVPDGAQTTASSVTGNLPAGGSYNIVLVDTGAALQTGWAALSYDTTNFRLGGYAVFRSHLDGRPDFEALVPLSAYDDSSFFLPFDNLNGFVTSMALLNPASTASTNAHLTFLDNQGNTLATDTIFLAPGRQLAFAISDKYPAMQGKIGTLYVTSDTQYLSALGFRFNPGGAFTTVPVMNY